MEKKKKLWITAIALTLAFVVFKVRVIWSFTPQPDAQTFLINGRVTAEQVRIDRLGETTFGFFNPHYPEGEELIFYHYKGDDGREIRSWNAKSFEILLKLEVGRYQTLPEWFHSNGVRISNRISTWLEVKSYGCPSEDECPEMRYDRVIPVEPYQAYRDPEICGTVEWPEEYPNGVFFACP